MKKRAIKNVKHRLAKAYRRVVRTGDDWAVSTNKQYIEADRQKIKKQIKEEVANV